MANRWSWAPSARAAPKWSDEGGGTDVSPPVSPRGVLASIQGTMALLALGLPLVISAALPGWVFALWALAGGGLTGLAFPVAVACQQPERETTGRVAGTLYGGDLVGACLGALVASALLLPILGIPQTCAFVALVCVAGVAVVV